MRFLAPLLVLLGCSVQTLPDTGPSETSADSEPASTTGAATAGATTGGDTGAPTTGGSDACGPPPGVAVCNPGPTDPNVPLCGARTEADCEEPLKEDVECRWVDTEIYPADAVECAAPKLGGACIAVSAVGNGCEAPTTCAGTVENRTRYRFTADCQVEVFQGDFCGYSVLSWGNCRWQDAPSAACPLPWPSQGPAACNCAC